MNANQRAMMQARMIKDILAKPGMKGRVIETVEFECTKHNDALAALVVAEDADNAFLLSAMEQFVMAAKLCDPDKFIEAKEKFGTQPRVLFVDPELVSDTFLRAVEKRVYQFGVTQILARLFSK